MQKYFARKSSHTNTDNATTKMMHDMCCGVLPCKILPRGDALKSRLQGSDNHGLVKSLASFI